MVVGCEAIKTYFVKSNKRFEKLPIKNLSLYEIKQIERHSSHCEQMPKKHEQSTTNHGKRDTDALQEQETIA